MKIFVGVDMEGATGVAHRDHVVPGGRDYERAREWLTGDVRAAVEGAVAAGATEVWVNDGHGDMRNLLIDRLPDAARLVVGPAQSRNKPLVQVTGIEQGGFEACLLVGFHSRAGTPGGLLSHTWVGMLVHEITLQGRPAGEVLLDAAIVGHYDTPVVLVTGADDVCREAREDLGDDLEVVEVKRALGPTACASWTPSRAQQAIRKAAERAVRARETRTPWKTTPPVEMEVVFHRREMATRALATQEGEPRGERGVRYRAPDVPSAARQVWRGLEMALREDAGFLK
ncbi:MAG: M55 family metallopeptidase [Planctomycetota bacterium]|jgi:D-amino peptidase